jgi:hypothetical protein
MEEVRDTKTSQATTGSTLSDGLSILARIIAREEIGKRGLGHVENLGSSFDEMADAIIQPAFRKILINE